MKTGLRQGDPLSTTLFNFAVETRMRRGKLNRVTLINDRRYRCLVYADDITIIGRTKSDLGTAINILNCRKDRIENKR